MINKLKRKFILLSLTALLTLLVVIVAGMNVLNYNTVVREADMVLTMLSDNGGKFPDKFGGGKDPFGMPPMSPEMPFESRFFSVWFDTAGNAVQTDVGHIAAIDRENAVSYGQKVLKKTRQAGFVDSFRYTKQTDNLGTRVIFLDCGRKLDAFYSFLFASLFVSRLGYLGVSVLIVFFAGRVIRPIAQSYEKQKQFITDAGHEMKTPLTVISANADILQMEQGESESLRDIKQQTQRLAALTNELVYLSRMEETDNPLCKIAFPVSDLVAEAVHPFLAVAQSEEKEIVTDIQPTLTMNGDAGSVEKLTSILMNNALKYSPAGSVIFLGLKLKGKQISLWVENKTENVLLPEQTEAVFDRFYRADSSRNSETGGHGIGLSVAKAIVTAHNGKITAKIKEENTFEITAIFPA